MPAGGSVQASCGEASGPSQVNFLGILPPLEKAVLEIANAMAGTPAEADAFSVGNIKKDAAIAMLSTALNNSPVPNNLFSLDGRCRSITGTFPNSVGGDCEIDGDVRPGLNGQRAYQVRFEMPLPHRFFGGISEDRWPAQNTQILNQSVTPD